MLKDQDVRPNGSNDKMVMMRSSQRVMRNIMSNKNCEANSRAMNSVQSCNNKRNEK